MTKEEFKHKFRTHIAEYLELRTAMQSLYPEVYDAFFDDLESIEYKLYELQFKYDYEQ